MEGTKAYQCNFKEMSFKRNKICPKDVGTRSYDFITGSNNFQYSFNFFQSHSNDFKTRSNIFESLSNEI